MATVLGLSPEKVLKYSLASHLVAGNVNIALVKQALGHRSKILGLLSQGTYHPIFWRPTTGWESLGRPPFCGPAGWSPESRWSIGPNGERISSHISVVFREAERVLVSSEKN